MYHEYLFLFSYSDEAIYEVIDDFLTLMQDTVSKMPPLPLEEEVKPTKSLYRALDEIIKGYHIYIEEAILYFCMLISRLTKNRQFQVRVS